MAAWWAPVRAVLLLFAAAPALGQAPVAYAPPNAPPPPGLRIERQPDASRYYPARERKAKVEGSTALGLTVRYDGTVTGCTVEGSSGSRALDAAACKLARDMRFERIGLAERFPKVEYGCCARLRIDWAGGTAVVVRTGPGRGARLLNRADLFASAAYPPAAAREGASGAVTIELAVSPEAALTGCAVVQSSGSAILDQETCRLASERAKLSPATDPYGRPIAGTVRTRMVWKLEQ